MYQHEQIIGKAAVVPLELDTLDMYGLFILVYAPSSEILEVVGRDGSKTLVFLIYCICLS